MTELSDLGPSPLGQACSKPAGDSGRRQARIGRAAPLAGGLSLPQLLAYGGIGALLSGGVALYLINGPAMVIDRMASTIGWLCM